MLALTAGAKALKIHGSYGVGIPPIHSLSQATVVQHWCHYQLVAGLNQ